MSSAQPRKPEGLDSATDSVTVSATDSTPTCATNSAAKGAAYRIVPVTADLIEIYRDTRLAALIDAPDAFGGTYAATAALDRTELLRRVAANRFWLALQGNRPIGTVATFRHEGNNRDLELIGMWVAGASRGGAVARDLVQTVLDYASEIGRSRVTLHVVEGNERAHRLYRSCGFRETGVVVEGQGATGVREIELAALLAEPS